MKSLIRLCLIASFAALTACSDDDDGDGNSNGGMGSNPFGSFFEGQPPGGGSSGLPLVGVCNMPSSGMCMEYYSNHPGNGVSCGTSAGGRCPQGSDLIGVCKSTVVAAQGISFQTVTYNYGGSFSVDMLKDHCSHSGGQFSAQP